MRRLQLPTHFIRQMCIILTPKQRRYLVFLFLVMLVGAFLEALGVSIVVPFLTVITQENLSDRFPYFALLGERLGLKTQEELALGCMLALILIFILKAVYLLAEYRLQSDYLSSCKLDAQDRLTMRLLNKPYAYFLERNSAEMQRLMIYDLNNVFIVLFHVLFMLTEIVISAMLLITLFLIEPVMSTWVLVIISSVVLVVMTVIQPMLHDAGVEAMKYDRIRSRWISQGFVGIKEVKHMHAESFIADRIHESGLYINKRERLRVQLNSIPKLVIETTCICGMLGVMAGMTVSGRTLSSLLPAIGAFAMAAIKLMPSANKVTAALSSIIYNMPAIDNIAEILGENKEEGRQDGNPAAAEENGAADGMDPDRGSVVFRHVSFTYPHTEHKILDDVSVTIRRGEMVGIMGVSGAGKTTFADVMMGLLAPDEGSVSISGTIGYIPQSIFLMDDTVRANVSFGIPPEQVSDDIIWECLEEAQLADYFRTVPEGLDTRVGERGVRLSGGQAQRIGIARALYRQPDILVFDEATSALDLETEAAVIEAVNNMHGRKTIVIIAHKSGVLVDCDIIYRVKNGKLE